MARKGHIRFTCGVFVVERFATIRRGLRVPPERDLIVGQGATILGDIEGGGSIYLAKGAIVRGSIRAGLDVVVGSEARLKGEVQARGNALLLEGVRVGGSVRAAGRIRIIGAHVGGPVHALGDIEVRGNATLIDVHAAGRVRSLWPLPLEPAAMAIGPSRECSATVVQTLVLPAAEASTTPLQRVPSAPDSPVPPEPVPATIGTPGPFLHTRGSETR